MKPVQDVLTLVPGGFRGKMIRFIVLRMSMSISGCGFRRRHRTLVDVLE